MSSKTSGSCCRHLAACSSNSCLRSMSRPHASCDSIKRTCVSPLHPFGDSIKRTAHIIEFPVEFHLAAAPLLLRPRLDSLLTQGLRCALPAGPVPSVHLASRVLPQPSVASSEHSKDLLFRKPAGCKGNGWCLRRTMLENNGESTPRNIRKDPRPAPGRLGERPKPQLKSESLASLLQMAIPKDQS